MKVFLFRKVCLLSACIFFVIGTLQAFENFDVAEDAASGIGWYDGTAWMPFEVGLATTSTTNERIVAAISWTGTTDTDWFTSTNWSSGTVPTAADDVTIPNVTNTPSINSAAVANSITIRLVRD